MLAVNTGKNKLLTRGDEFAPWRRRWFSAERERSFSLARMGRSAMRDGN